jgi:PAS domain S-box-containing protein
MTTEQKIFMSSPLAQVLVDPMTDTILLANISAQNTFWCQNKALINQPFSQFFAGLFPDLVVLTQEILTKGKAWRAEMMLRSPEDKHHRKVEVTGYIAGDFAKHEPSFREDENDQPNRHIVFCFQDKDVIDRNRAAAQANEHYLSGISQWRRVEKVFQEIEQNNQLILNAAGEGIYGVDSEGRTTFLNPIAEELLGWSKEDLFGKNIHTTIHHSHSSGDAYNSIECPIYAAFCDGEVHRVVDEVFWRRDGTSFPVEYTSTPIKDNGHLVGAVVIFRDVTEQKHSQKKLLGALREIESLKQRLEQENEYLKEEISDNSNYKNIVGKSSAVQHLVNQIELVSPTNATVLICGESGTGKELIARAIHEASERSHRPLIRVNCAAIPRDLFESEFFGHVKGAFTGAINNRLGRFELADGGTIFLDEVGEIPIELQSKLLRVLQEQQFERVGEATTRKVDIRVIAATNQALKTLVEQKLFREDLYFRLNVFPIVSVPLRERREDIPLLAIHFIEKSVKKFNKGPMKISLAQTNQLMNYDWPGNIRELENIIERQVIVSPGENLVFDNLPINQETLVVEKRRNQPQPIVTELDRKQQLKSDIIDVLKATGGKIYGQDGAAQFMGIKPTTLASRIKKYRIDISAYKNQS